MSKHCPLNAPATATTRSTALRPIARAGVLALLGAGIMGLAQAESLVELYAAAKAYDAAYQASKAQAESVRYKVEQAYAAQRPSLGLKAGLQRNVFQGTADVPEPYRAQYGNSYSSSSTSKSAGVVGKYELYNKATAIKIEQAQQLLAGAEADMETAEQDLTARLAQAYFEVLGAQDVLSTTQTNKKALAEQLAAAKRNFEVGNATITDTREAQARFDLATAQEIAATNDLRFKRIALDQLVGRTDVKPSPLTSPAKIETLSSGQMDEWVALSAKAPTVRQAELKLTAAKLDVDAARSDSLPKVEATGAYTRQDVTSKNVNSKGTSGTNASIGVELTMPLYAGGAIQNNTREKLALQEKAELDLSNVKRTLALRTRQAFSGVQSGLAQVKALEAAEASTKLALEATQMGYKVGVRINKDVLDAQTALSNAQKDLYKARYDVIVGSVKLKQAAGSLRPEDLDELNKLLLQP
jgi:outer membrane protein